MAVSSYWYAQGKEKSADKQAGFLFGEAYTSEELLNLIDKDCICVASDGSTILGYFLFDNYTSNATTKFYKQVLKGLVSSKKITPNRVCVRAQVAIHPDHQNRGLSKRLTKFLSQQHKEKYDTIFSVVDRQNPKMQVHISNNWKIVEQDELYNYVLLEL